MINIAICNNNLNTCSDLVNYVCTHFKSYVRKVDDFSNGMELLDSVYNGEIYNIIVLNDRMTPLDGIAAGNILRTLPAYKDAIILFTSSHILQRSAIMDIHPFAYMKNPVDINFFHNSMSAAINIMKKRLGYVTLNQKGGNINVDIKDIFYIESGNTGKCIVNFENTSIQHQGTMSSLKNEISMSGHTFVRTHSSYAVNILHLKGFTPSILQLSNGVSIPISKSYKSCVIRECNINLIS